MPAGESSSVLAIIVWSSANKTVSRIFWFIQKWYLNLFGHCLTIVSTYIKTVGDNGHPYTTPQFISTTFPISNCFLCITISVLDTSSLTLLFTPAGNLCLSLCARHMKKEYQTWWWLIIVILDINHEADLCMKMDNQWCKTIMHQQWSEISHHDNQHDATNPQQDRKCMYNMTSRRVRATIVAVEKQ